jgi:phage gpG-like protein
MKSLSNLAGDMKLKADAIKKLETQFPIIIGVECVKEIKGSFAKQGYNSPGEWPKRSQVTNLLYEYNRTNDYRTPKLGKISKYKNPYKGSVVHSSNPILLQTRNLRDSVSYNASGKGVLIGVFHRMSPTGHDSLGYAKIHNEGGTFMMFGKHSAHMPRRQFMPKPSQGPTRQMWDMIDNKYSLELKKIMGSWKT